MRGEVSKEQAKRLSQLKRDRQKVVVEQNKEKEGTEMELETENERRESVSFFGGGRFMFSQMNEFQRWVPSRDVTWAK